MTIVDFLSGVHGLRMYKKRVPVTKYAFLLTLHNLYFVKYDFTVSFMAQVLDTVTYFVSQVLVVDTVKYF